MAPLLATAMIVSSAVSSSNTGGNTVSSGGYVENGPSYSSVSVENISDESGASSTVSIETDNNGTAQSQTYTNTAPPGTPLVVNVSTSSGQGDVSVHVGSYAGTSAITTAAHHMTHPNATSSASSSVAATTSSEMNIGLSSTSTQSFIDLIRQFFSFFSFRW